jgi:cytochrome P450 family 110
MQESINAGAKYRPPSTSLPGPRGALLQTIRYVRNPLAFYLSAIEKFGDSFTAPSVLGPIAVISHPDDIRALFALPSDAFERWSVDAVEPLLGRNSVLLSSGHRHSQQRRMIAPAFHRERIFSIAGRIPTITDANVQAWPQGQTFNLQDQLIALSIDVVLAAVLGAKSASEIGAYRMAITDTLSAMSPSLMLTRAISERLANLLGPYARFKRARALLDTMLYAEIDAAKMAQQTNDTMLGILLATRDEVGQPLSQEEIRDQLMTLIFAGHETSAIGLTWGIYWLQHSPNVLTALLEELDSAHSLDVETLTKLPYLDAVCKETLRLHPVVPEVIRKSKRPLTLRHTVLPAETPVAACIVATHHRADLYVEPHRFNPQRFIDRRYASHEYLPFGGGAHRCPGEAFALLEMKVILANLVTRYQFTLEETAPVTPTLRSITMEPRGGLRVRIRSREHRE